MNLYNKSSQIGVVILLVLQIAIFSGCDQYKELTNDPPKINSFTVPVEVEYGETVKLKVKVFDPEDDALTYTWDVSDGTLLGDTGPEVQWTAPKLPPEEMVPPTVVTVHVYVRDGGEEDVSKTASITVFSRAYRVAQTLSGTYTLVAKRVHGDPVEVAGILRLTTTTFTRETRDILEGEIQGQTQFVSGSYKLVKPFDERSGMIHWFTHGEPTPSIGTYTWDGKFFVITLPATATQSVYSRTGAVPGDGDEEDVKPEPIDGNDGPVEVDAEEGKPEPINADGKPIDVTDQTFKPRVLDSEVPVVVEFWANWCPFCKQMKPIVEEVALEHRDTFIVGRLDIDDNPQTTKAYKVNGIPAYIIFRDGAEAARIVGVVPKAVFAQRILDALQ